MDDETPKGNVVRRFGFARAVTSTLNRARTTELRRPGFMTARDVTIEPKKFGLAQPEKGGFPLRYGEGAQITTSEMILELDAAGRLKYMTGRTPEWPHPLEYLKRTDGNDWVYYSLGEYADHVSLYGEYYLPCPNYPTNRPLGGEPFRRKVVVEVLRSGPKALKELGRRRGPEYRELEPFLEGLEVNEPERLAHHAALLHEIIDSPVPVLPPDARHVDYDVIPVIVADGCRYGCRFCCVNDHKRLAPRTKDQIRAQLEGLQRWLGRQKGNYQGLFLGLHDALAVRGDLLRWTIEKAYTRLGFDGSTFSRPHLFMFASVDSLLNADDELFDWLDKIPWSTFINVGLESADSTILAQLGKPLTPDTVKAGLQRMLEINALCPRIEVTANFVLLADEGHSDEEMIEVINENLSRRSSRGVCYLSPLMTGSERPRGSRRDVLRRLHRLQREALLPLHLYLIQRL